ncbi:hypothetical protein [Modestobacter versicolor]|uniref:Uncharacterized protein n=1 Tax=Modestobacter versicolor TaxID=429133 RepID=A0A839Y6V7_9ACTN|nr:hypothetical protein [Modestobacter versicolor]MBB3678465.1 hypothetical protein [Modestobacter versicolor]
MSTASNAHDDAGQAPAEARKHTAGAYDVRTVIAGLIGLYGIVLTLMGLFANSAEDKAKTGDWNANLWSGIVMIAVALFFAIWLKLRPVVVDPVALEKEKGEGTSDGSDATPH